MESVTCLNNRFPHESPKVAVELYAYLRRLAAILVLTQTTKFGDTCDLFCAVVYDLYGTRNSLSTNYFDHCEAG